MGATVLVLGAGGSAAENVVDGLRRAGGHRVLGADASPVRLTLSSADSHHVVPRADAGGYADALRAIVTCEDVDVVHAQPDPDVRALAAIRSSVGAATYLPCDEALAVAADKHRTAVRFAAAGVPAPEVVRFASLDDVVIGTERIVARHGRAWVRAREGAGSKAALPVRSGVQAAAWVAWWRDERGLPVDAFMACEHLPGREFAYQSLWQDGELVAGQARERLEYLYGHLTPSGQTSTPALARTVCEPEVDRTAMAAVRALDPRPHGVFCVDLKQAADGTAKVTEVNAGRFFTTSNFFAAAGLNMADLLVRGALGERLPRLGTSPLPPDLYWVRMVDMGHRLLTRDDVDARVLAGR